MRPEDRIVITGIGLTAPNGNTLAEFRKASNELRRTLEVATAWEEQQAPAATGITDLISIMSPVDAID